MKKVFITRSLHKDSVFFTTLSGKGFDIHGESLIDFALVPVPRLPSADWVFFYSQQGVRFFFQQISPEKIAGMKLAALGPGTAAALEQQHLKADFIGDGDPENTAAAFLQTAKGLQVLFPQARESRQSVQTFLENEFGAIDLVVYENAPRTDFNLPDFDILVFTSPMNAEAYFAQKSWKPFQTVIAIGKTTAAALAVLGIRDVIVSEQPSEESLAESVLGI